MSSPSFLSSRISSLRNHLTITRNIASTSRIQATTQATTSASNTLQYPYFVPRNTRGNLPVYTDVRNGGTRYHVLVRNIDGNAHVLAKDLTRSLFPQHSPEAERIKIEIVRSKNLIITGGRWRNQVTQWLREKGF